jgi:hypothetical protein
MKSWIFALVGLSCLIGSLTVPAFAKQGGKAEPQKATDQKPFKEVKFKLEWSGQGAKGTPAAIETITLVCADGQTSMSNNALIVGGDTYRRITIHPESQPDGSYIVDIVVSETNKEQDIPRISTVAKVRKGETKIVQTRISKSSSGEVEYVFAITAEVE